MDNFSKVFVDVEGLSVDAEGVAGPGPDACSVLSPRPESCDSSSSALPGHTTTSRPEYSSSGPAKLVLFKFNFFEK